MTIGNIIGIVEEFELYTERELERITRTEIAGDFRRAVSIRPISAEVVDPRSGRPSQTIIAFSLSFDGENPSKVQKVTNEITTLYLDENLKDRTAQTKSTSDFLTAESDLLATQLEDLDGKIANFKEQNEGALPQQNQFNLSVVERTELQIDSLDYRIKELQKRKIQLDADLLQISPSAPTMLSNGQMVLGESDRLKALQSQLRQFESVYQPEHPSLLRIHREINTILEGGNALNQHNDMAKQLAQQRDLLAVLESKYTPDHSEILQSKRVINSLEASLVEAINVEAEVTPDNPAYLVLRSRLNATNEDIRNNTEMVKALREKIERYEGYLSRAPQIEKEYQYLLRDYQNTRMKYQEIRAKKMSADLAQTLESEQKGERFTLIQPPELPIDPVSPNRTAMVFLSVILGLGAGLAVVVLQESMSAAVFGAAEVARLTGVAPLAVIGYMETKEEESKHNRKRLLLVLGIIVVGMFLLLLFHLFVKPLDVTWYILMRKLGI
jgi:uncharacterized protein involved in exopolysaccharide biosynthesis